MSATTQTAAPHRADAAPKPGPSFTGAVRGELGKLRRQRATLGMLVGGGVLYAVLTALILSSGNQRVAFEHAPQAFVAQWLDIQLALFDTGSGILLLLVSARLVGMEYSSGTIRILLARGLGRLQLLAAKWVALAIAGLGLLVAFAAVAAVALASAAFAWQGSLRGLTTLPAQTFHQLWVTCLIALLSMAVSILLGTAAAVVGRSLAFGIGAALAFFPADNFGTIVLGLIASLTHQRVWADATAYLLGPNLNAVAGKLITAHQVRPAFAVPLVQMDATRVLAVIGAWAAALLILQVALIARRDVLE
ncbi:MAG TPA: ABC transporter permease [Candidatus Binatia bacterium]|nr:ABC transporter permease [Candidatus Binatia bacterium]